jgi:hypothetical protein
VINQKISLNDIGESSVRGGSTAGGAENDVARTLTCNLGPQCAIDPISGVTLRRPPGELTLNPGTLLQNTENESMKDENVIRYKSYVVVLNSVTDMEQ